MTRRSNLRWWLGCSALALVVGTQLVFPLRSAGQRPGENLLGDDVEPLPNEPLVPVPPPPPLLNEHCVVAVLNRVAQVRPDGTWVLRNVPTNFGPLRARATCVVDGVTHAGQSDLFTVPPNGQVSAGEIRFDVLEPIPRALRVSAPTMTLTSPGATVALTVTALFGDGSSRDVTASADVSYRSSNAAIASVGTTGVVTAHASGPVLITVLREGLSAFIQQTVSLSNTDSDNDGIPDDVEVGNGLDPNDPVDALKDPDRDELTNKEELVDFGTDPRAADSDGDTLSDREEVFAGSDGFVTNARLADTDGDGVRDALEIQSGSDPTNPNSLNLAQALSAIDLRPAPFILTVNTIVGEASQQLTTIGMLLDGTTIDLTSRSTGYSSNDLNVCNFGVQPGRVFAGGDGLCTITASNAGFMDQAAGTVRSFAPTALSFLDIPGYANNVDVAGDVAYVAAGAAGLHVVNVADRTHPALLGSVDTPGNANDVKVAGTLAYIADGPGGLRIATVAPPQQPALVGGVTLPDVAHGVVVRGALAYVAAGAAGLQVIDVTTPAQPVRLGSLDTPGLVKGVDVDGTLAVVADHAAGVHVIDVSDPTNPRLLGSVPGGQVQDVVLRRPTAYLADFSRGFTTVNVTNPGSPVLGPSVPAALGGLLNDVAVAGRFALGADVFFVNGIPIIDVDNAQSPIARAILNLSSFRDDNGVGIAVDGSYVYLTAGTAISDNGTTGTTRLYIGQYLSFDDTAGIAPDVVLTAPAAGATVLEGETILLQADAEDDVGVASVAFLVDGVVVFTDTTVPYEGLLTVPGGVSSLALSARAVDLAGNTAVTAAISVTVVPDPRTTAAGEVRDVTGRAVPGAALLCSGVAGLADVDGRFAIVGIPTVRGDVTCTATFTVGNRTVRALGQPVAPVPSGITDVGVIRQPPATEAGSERDRWRFVANAGQVVTLRMTRIANLASGASSLDPVLEVRDSRGFIVASDDESGSTVPSGPGRNAVIADLTLPATDTYDVIARGAGSTLGPYSLEITPNTIALVLETP